jgi:hypothetical protein
VDPLPPSRPLGEIDQRRTADPEPDIPEGTPVSLPHGTPDGGLRHTRQPAGVPQQRQVKVSVAEALRAQFPLHAGAGRRPARIPVAEALRSRFPQPRISAEDDHALASTRGTARPALPRRIRGIPIPARQAQPVSTALLRRVLDGLQRL